MNRSHEVGFQTRGWLRSKLGLGAREWRLFCNTCGATSPWQPYATPLPDRAPCPRLEVVK